MSTVTPIHDRLSPEEVVSHLDAAVSMLSVANLDYRDENVMLRSWCASLVKRYTAVRVRQMRLVLAGVVIGAALAFLLDGHVAVWLDDALNAIGWTA